MTIEAQDLTGAARSAFNTYRDFFGLSEATALAAVEADGLVESAPVDGLPEGAERDDPSFVSFARDLGRGVGLEEGVRRAVAADRAGGRSSPAWAVEMAAGRVPLREGARRSTSAGAGKRRRRPAAPQESKPGERRGRSVELVESRVPDTKTLEERESFFTETFGLSEAGAKHAADF